MAKWEYCILTRLTWGVDTKWYVNRLYQHSDTDMPVEVTEPLFKDYNDRMEQMHAARVYPLLPAILNMFGADGWELIDDMNTGMPGGEGLVFKRVPSARAVAKPPAKKSAKKPKRK
ncbi:MAG: hypothetical protein FJ030_09430 [Chloroflexi bacterium]|nr:hypothetical protein [Chloroflexota bacterium]